MKTRPVSRRRAGGFTLVELLVVISIIVVLAAMTFAGIQIAVNKQKALQTKTNASGLQTAIEGFYSTYSRLPDFGAQGDESQTEGQSGQELLTILLGKEEANNSMQNKKQIRFLTVEETKIKSKGGLLYGQGGSGAKPEGLYDAWGRPFRIMLDTDYDQEINDPLKQGNVVRNKVVIVYSYGPDGKTGGKFAADDVKTW
ncbi:type II secretion system protein [Haloferula sp. BvORR071]|uniref:type II secretion system protein n=1 Tax=Haloferula sp. BvORR071 TaxID=1396141 RepID=UPI000551962D|nr:type II secretion system protein [Haloferula sp. BvORR071]